MSVVVAIKDGDAVWIGCDSQVTTGYTKATLKLNKKIWKPEKDSEVVMGVVGAVRDLNILETEEKWIDELTGMKNEVNYKYIVRSIVPNIFDVLRKYSRVQNDKGIESIESNIVFAYKDKLFSINGDGSVIESDDIVADGSGHRLCLGAWNSLKDKDISVKEKLVSVIKAACESDLYVNYPIIIMNTKNNEVEVIDS